MKNTLDWMYDKHVGGKVFGLMSTLGGVTNANTLNHMRIAVRWLHGWAVPQQLAIGHVKEAFNEEQKLVDHPLQERLESLVEAVMDASMKLRA
jgi:FMN reductase